MQVVTRLENWPRSLCIALGGASLVIVGFLDYFTGYEMSFSAFYLIPILLLAWLGGRGPAWAAPIFATAAQTMADLFSGRPFGSLALLAWNAGTRMAIYTSVSLLLLSFRSHVERERSLARTDPLTGVANSRAFMEAARAEAERARRYRHPISLAYLDLDKFKQVNDNFGHAAGDAVLRAVAVTIRESVRSTDIVARVGGDEFVVLFPETSATATAAAIAKIRERFARNRDVQRWSVGLSVGTETVRAGTAVDIDEVIARADARMYEAKQRAKGRAKK